MGRWTEATLKEHIDTAVKVASALLAENYLAQDRRRLIKAIELLDEATRSLDGGMWIAPERAEQTTVVPASPEPAKSLIARN